MPSSTKPKERLESCPKCNGLSGFTFLARIHMEGVWGERAESTGSSSVAKTVKCRDCGARISRRTAEAWDSEEAPNE